MGRRRNKRESEAGRSFAKSASYLKGFLSKKPKISVSGFTKGFRINFLLAESFAKLLAYRRRRREAADSNEDKKAR